MLKFRSMPGHDMTIRSVFCAEARPRLHLRPPRWRLREHDVGPARSDVSSVVGQGLEVYGKTDSVLSF